MADKIDFSFQAVQTSIRLIYGDITQLKVDAIVSPDDAYISACSGISNIICETAGHNLRSDVRKFTFPKSPGSIVVTSAGQLHAKYIFHAVLLHFTQHQEPKKLLPFLVQRVMAVAGILGIQSLAIPWLVAHRPDDDVDQEPLTQLAGFSSKELELLLRSLSCYLASNQSSLRDISIIIDEDPVNAHPSAEQEHFESLKKLHEEIDRWAVDAMQFNERVPLLRDLITKTSDDDEMRPMLLKRLDDECLRLHQIFGGSEAQALQSLMHGHYHHHDEQLSMREYETREKRLHEAIKKLSEDLETKKALRYEHGSRLNLLEQQQARKGYNTDPEVITEIKGIQPILQQLDVEIQKLEADLANAQHDLDELEHKKP
jgi:hypothetical protein